MSVAGAIRDRDVTYSKLQSRVYQTDWQSVKAAGKDTGIISGGLVVQRGPGVNMSVDVSAGTTIQLGVQFTHVLTNVALSAAHASLDRIDVIYVLNGTPAVSTGVASATAKPRNYDTSLPDGAIILAFVYVPGGVTAITDGTTGGLPKLIEDRRSEPSTIHAMLSGRSGGQTIKGGTGSGESLTLQSTAHATRGLIAFGSAQRDYFDEANARWVYGGGTDAYGGANGAIGQVLHGTAGSPVTSATSTWKIARSELISSTPNALDPQYGSGLFSILSSQIGNKQQPTAIAGWSLGYSEGGNYVLGASFAGLQTSGANVGGNVGGAMGAYFLARSQSASASSSIWGQQISLNDWRGLDQVYDPAGLGVAGIDLDHSSATTLGVNRSGGYSGAAIWTRGLSGSMWDVGIGLNGIRSADIRTDSSAVTVLDGRGTHTDGIDFTNGTYSGSMIKFPALTAYTPTITSAGGTLTSVDFVFGKYLRLGKMLYVEILFRVVTNGTGSVALLFTLPLSLTVGSLDQFVTGRTSSGAMMVGKTSNTLNTVALFDYAGGYPGASGVFYNCSGWIEVN